MNFDASQVIICCYIWRSILNHVNMGQAALSCSVLPKLLICIMSSSSIEPSEGILLLGSPTQNLSQGCVINIYGSITQPLVLREGNIMSNLGRIYAPRVSRTSHFSI